MLEGLFDEDILMYELEQDKVVKFSLVLFGVLLLSSFVVLSASAYAQTEQIPSWIKNIFVFYADEQISESDLLNAIEYLVDIGIIPVSEKTNMSIQDMGNFTMAYNPTDNSTFDDIRLDYEERKFIETNVDYLNELFALPYDVSIVMDECGEEDAFYDSELKEIVLCYDYVAFYEDLIFDDVKTDKEVWHFADTAIIATLYHEVGHALVDVYDLPITGAEEDAVDQFATIISNGLGDIGSEYNHAAMTEFYKTGTEEYNSDELEFYGEHSLGLQRYYNIMCWTFGSDVDRYSYLVTDWGLPEERAEWCEEEYEKISNSWNTLLEPYVKNQSMN